MEGHVIDATRAVSTCALGHKVEVVSALGVVRNTIHRYASSTDPVSGRLREVRCPACEATAKRLVRERGWDRR